MKLIFSLLLLASFSAQASPILSMKERLRIHLWVNGMEERPVVKAKAKTPILPEEIERPLRKI